MESQITGTFFDSIEGVLRDFPFYREYLRGEITRACFAREVLNKKNALLESGIPLEDVHFATRFPRDQAQFVDRLLEDLYKQEIITTTSYDKTSFQRHCLRMAEDFDHGPYHTFIYPEEARALFALTDILRPTRLVFLGSYYAYWAFWALPHLANSDVFLVDMDHEVNKIACANLQKFGFKDRARVITGDGVDFLANCHGTFDMFVIDAECPRDHPDVDYRGKNVYYPLTKAAVAVADRQCTFVYHNILLRHFDDDPFFSDRIAKNHRDYSKLLPLLRDRLRVFRDYSSTAGLGVGCL